jgi:hypothetical protein
MRDKGANGIGGRWDTGRYVRLGGGDDDPAVATELPPSDPRCLTNEDTKDAALHEDEAGSVSVGERALLASSRPGEACVEKESNGRGEVGKEYSRRGSLIIAVS